MMPAKVDNHHFFNVSSSISITSSSVFSIRTRTSDRECVESEDVSSPVGRGQGTEAARIGWVL